MTLVFYQTLTPSQQEPARESLLLVIIQQGGFLASFILDEALRKTSTQTMTKSFLHQCHHITLVVC